MSNGLSLVIPCYNEEQAIPHVLADLEAKISTLQEKCRLAEVEVIVVNDGSTDNSQCEIKNFDFPIYVSNAKCSGYGHAIKKGMQVATHDLVAIMDMDSTCDPLDFASLARLLQDRPSLPMVIGRRIHKGTSMPVVRILGNLIYSFCILLFRRHWILDPCSGIRVYRRDWLLTQSRLLPDDLNFSLATTLLASYQPDGLAEFPVSYFSRRGESKLSELRHGLQFFLTIVKFSTRKLPVSVPTVAGDKAI